MARDTTEYRTQDPEDPADEIIKRIQYLDWNQGTEPPLQEAAGLIYEMGNTQHPNRGSMHHRLAQMLLEVPGEYRMEVVAKVPADLRETMLEEMPAQVQDTINALAHRERNPGRNTPRTIAPSGTWRTPGRPSNSSGTSPARKPPTSSRGSSWKAGTWTYAGCRDTFPCTGTTPTNDMSGASREYPRPCRRGRNSARRSGGQRSSVRPHSTR